MTATRARRCNPRIREAATCDRRPTPDLNPLRSWTEFTILLQLCLQHSGGRITARKMVLGANSIAYQLYQNATRSTVWGNTVGTNTVAGTGNGNVQLLTVYGSVPAQATPPAGTYSDTVTVTVTY